MKQVLRIILAVLGGWFIGGFLNMSLINLGHQLFPMEGIDLNDLNALSVAFATADFTYFIFPFLAHALGTFVGAISAAIIAPFHKMKFALSIGALFLIGGIAACFIIPAPVWFIVLDLIVAYIPMAYMGGKIALALTSKKN